MEEVASIFAFAISLITLTDDKSVESIFSSVSYEVLAVPIATWVMHPIEYPLSEFGQIHIGRIASDEEIYSPESGYFNVSSQCLPRVSCRKKSHLNFFAGSFAYCDRRSSRISIWRTTSKPLQTELRLFSGNAVRIFGWFHDQKIVGIIIWILCRLVKTLRSPSRHLEFCSPAPGYLIPRFGYIHQFEIERCLVDCNIFIEFYQSKISIITAISIYDETKYFIYAVFFSSGQVRSLVRIFRCHHEIHHSHGFMRPSIIL